MTSSKGESSKSYSPSQHINLLHHRSDSFLTSLMCHLRFIKCKFSKTIVNRSYHRVFSNRHIHFRSLRSPLPSIDCFLHPRRLFHHKERHHQIVPQRRPFPRRDAAANERQSTFCLRWILVHNTSKMFILRNINVTISFVAFGSNNRRWKWIKWKIDEELKHKALWSSIIRTLNEMDSVIKCQKKVWYALSTEKLTWDNYRGKFL